MRTIKIGSIEIPARSSLDCETSYEWIGGETILRTIAGTGIRQETWKKLRATVSGSGWIPPGIEAVDTTQQQTVSFCAPVSVTCNASRQATLPSARRSDTGFTPWALALLPDGGVRETPVTVVNHVATADSSSGAIGYQVLYYPEITAWVSRPTQSFDTPTASWRWELFAEQV